MRANTLKRERNRLVREAIAQALERGVEPSTLINPSDPAFADDVWRFLLNTLVKMRLGLTRRGAELVGDCTACNRPALSVGRLRARCYECGLDMPSLDYLRLQLERWRGIGKVRM